MTDGTRVDAARLFLIALIVCVLSWGAIPFLMGDRVPRSQTPDPVQSFDSSRARQFAENLAERSPARVLGSLESRQASGYIGEELERMGYTVEFAHFKAVVAGRRAVGRNVVATRRGGTDKLLVLMTRYDNARTTFGGAMDNGSGVGVLLELANVFAAENLRHTLIVAAVDGGEWGRQGARDFIRAYEGREKIAALLSLDYVAMGLVGLRLEVVGQSGSYTPIWLRQLARQCLTQADARVQEPFGPIEYLRRALPASRKNHVPFLWANVPAIGLSSFSEDAERERKLLHSRADGGAPPAQDSFQRFGNVAEAMVRAMDSGTGDRTSAAGLRFSSTLFLGDRWVSFLNYLAFLPFFTLVLYQACRMRKWDLAGVGREVTELAAVWLTLTTVYGTVLAYSWIGWLPNVGHYPPLRDPILLHPRWSVVASVLAVAGFVAVLLHLVKRRLSRQLALAGQGFCTAKLVVALVLSIVVFLGLGYNSYWTVLLFLLPAWVWGLLGRGTGVGGRYANRALVLVAGVIGIVVAVSAAGAPNGWKTLWSMMVTVGGGTFPPRSVLVALAGIAVAVRFLAIQSYTGDAISDSSARSPAGQRQTPFANGEDG